MTPKHPSATKQTFDAKSRAEGWVCTRCGKRIEFEDREAYGESRRCRRCHDELDPDSGRIPAL